MYAYRDLIRAAKIGYGYAECEITGDGKPTERCGNWFVALHGGGSRPGSANERNLYELFYFSVTLTGRVAIPMDRVGDQLIARNVPLVDANSVPLAQRQGFNAKVEQLRTFLHMNWRAVVLQGQTPNSANDNLAAWGPSGATVYGFCEPPRYQGEELPVLVGGEWFGSDPDALEFGLKTEIKLQGAKRFQPISAAQGVFV